MIVFVTDDNDEVGISRTDCETVVLVHARNLIHATW